MRPSQRCFKVMSFAALAVFTLVYGTGCSLGEALIDGVFLGVSETVAALLGNALIN